MKIPDNIKWKATGKTLGQGGQATVTEVIDKTSGDDAKYALKALAKGRPKSAYLRFVREIQAIKKINHPSIIKIFDNSDPESEFQFYVMELVQDAISLKKLINTENNPFHINPIKSLELFIRLVEVVKVCEQTDPPIVHRDISPANILILPDKTIKIIDFGLCQIENEDTITLIDEGVGTQNYMSPECESGVEEKITSTSDLYSAGKILWSAITNNFAFAREKPVFNSKSMKVLFPNNPQIWHLQHVFKKTIRNNPKDRWKNSEEALTESIKIHNLINHGYLPIEKLSNNCPICGYGNLEPFEGGHIVFGNPNPSSIQSLQCSYCGYCFAINTKKIREYLNKEKDYE